MVRNVSFDTPTFRSAEVKEVTEDLANKLLSLRDIFIILAVLGVIGLIFFFVVAK